MKLTTEEEFPQGQNFGCTNEQMLLLNCRQPSAPVIHRCHTYTCCRMVRGPPLIQKGLFRGVVCRVQAYSSSGDSDLAKHLQVN